MDSQSGALAAATVLARVLDIAGDPADLAAVFVPLPSAGPMLAWTVEVSANNEDVAFLVHAYDLRSADGPGGHGRDLLAGDIGAMDEAAALGTPGPRLVAQAEIGAWGIVVAASPATVARLMDETSDPAPERRPASPRERERAADALLSALRNADRRAAAYLSALGDGSGDPTTGERALALFVADAPSLANLSRALRAAVDRAAPPAAPTTHSASEDAST